MTAAWSTTERKARARTRIERGTSEGVIAREAGAPRAEATPVPNASTKNGHVWLAPARVTASRPSMTTVSTAVATARIVRRGNRSARCPAGRASSGRGMNIARPTSPRSSGLLRTAYTCQPIATNDISTASPVATTTPRKRVKSRYRSGELRASPTGSCRATPPRLPRRRLPARARAPRRGTRPRGAGFATPRRRAP